MVELWLKFTDENGKPQRIPVEQEKFAIGRTPENDLAIPRGNLSRQHARIERFADIFVISDCGSSNGTTHNAKEMSEPVALKNGDKLNLGGGLEIEVEIISDEENADDAAGDGDESAAGNAGGAGNGSAASSAAAAGGGASAKASDDAPVSSSIFFIAPILGVLILVLLGAAFLIFRNTGDPTIASGNPKNSPTPVIDDTPDDTPTPDNSPTPVETQKPPTTPGTTSTPVVQDTPSSPEAKEAEKIKTSSASLLRRIATKDPNAFLTTGQNIIVADRIKPFRKSSTLAANIKNAKKNAAQLDALAKSKGLTPQFLTVAALAELGNQPGDVLAKANEMATVLSDLKQVLGDELYDDCLLIIAAYDQGKAGNLREMRDMVAKLSDQTTTSSRIIRTIWYLHDNGKITDAQYERALRFVAIGTIAQNPPDFDVNSEAMVFN